MIIIDFARRVSASHSYSGVTEAIWAQKQLSAPPFEDGKWSGCDERGLKVKFCTVE